MFPFILIRRFHHTCIPSPDGTRLLIAGGREANGWSRPAVLATEMPDEFGSSIHVEAEEETLPPSAYTLNIETAKLTPGLPGSALSPKDTCKMPSGIPEPRLSWASLEVNTLRGRVERLVNVLYPSKPVLLSSKDTHTFNVEISLLLLERDAWSIVNRLR